jgi:hypothetical protein
MILKLFAACIAMTIITSDCSPFEDLDSKVSYYQDLNSQFKRIPTMGNTVIKIELFIDKRLSVAIFFKKSNSLMMNALNIHEQVHEEGYEKFKEVFPKYIQCYEKDKIVVMLMESFVQLKILAPDVIPQKKNKKAINKTYAGKPLLYTFRSRLACIAALHKLGIYHGVLSESSFVQTSNEEKKEVNYPSAKIFYLPRLKLSEEIKLEDSRNLSAYGRFKLTQKPFSEADQKQFFMHIDLFSSAHFCTD